MPKFLCKYFRSAFYALLITAIGADFVAAQEVTWGSLIAEADSIGPVTPRAAPGRRIECASGIQRADSVLVGASEEFILFSSSRRTRGMFSSEVIPARGRGRFALREIFCDGESGRPLTFVLERDHRYFYLIFNLTDSPTYGSLRFLTGFGESACVRWEPSVRRFGPGKCQAAPGSKC